MKGVFMNTVTAEVPDVLALELSVATAIPLNPDIMRRLELAIRGIIAAVADDVIRDSARPSPAQVGLVLGEALRPYPPLTVKPS